MFSSLRSIRAGGICFAALVIAALLSASAPGQTAPAQSKPAEPDKPPLKQEELDSICAPIALYPDQVLSQILMASTYPVEVIQAERWGKENKALKDKELTAALEKKEWDASVKSLVNFPSVLTMMSEKLDWTIKLGDAFIGQQADVMNTIQRLRAKAKTQGNLATNEQQKVVVEPAPAATQPTVIVEQTVTAPPTEIIRIESASPQVVYVPTYNPTVVYGTWPYPSYPPAAYYPPGYVAGAAALSFGVGLAVGAAWGYAWGGCNWGGSDVEIDVNRNTNINTNIDRDKAKANMDARQGTRDTRQTDRQGSRDTRQTNRQSGQGKFQHDPAHRNGVPYASNRDAQKFGGQSAQQAAGARDSYRGRATAGQQDISRNGASQYRNQVSTADRAGAGAGGAGNRASAGTANRAGAGGGAGAGAANRAGAGGGAAANRSSPAANRSASTGSRGSAFSGSSSSGSSARAASQRGASSRSSSGGGARSAPRGGGGRSGGGGRR